ncbi:dipeptidase [Calidifontibacter indicus]|uniref:Membrane dipeptidase n=1 Tax=Calidifontibacter indicus TaxID=419650 RepID=A0A3D9V376_9MICO|nr:dipeptidase [Calidifontibacter indicus]REF31591.1 membrane dipeptidase [Calidifontibacter indicus]
MSTSSPTTSDRISALLREHPLIDGHNDLPWHARAEAGYDFDKLDIATDLTGRGHTDLARLRTGGVGAQFWSVFVPSNLPAGKAVTATLEQIDAVHQMVARYSTDLGLARTADEVERVFASGRIASLLGAEGGQSIDSSLATLRMLYVLGVRYMTLTHNDNNPWADSATDEPAHGGLTRFGVEVVREMNRIGMMVDLSHVSADTMRAALAASTAPVIFSHSSAYAVCSSPRNAPDDVLETLRDNNGVIMGTFVPDFVSQACADWRAESREAAIADGVDPKDHVAFTAYNKQRAEQQPKPVATLADVVAHFVHLREVAGIDHIGVGGDYDGVDKLPEGLADVSTYPALLGALADLGWSDDDLAKVAGRNVLRVMRDVEAVARDEQQTRGPSLATIAELDG